MPSLPLLPAALAVGALVVAAVASVASRVTRSPRDTVRALARRNTPVGLIAQRTGLPLDVVRTALGTMDRAPSARQEPLAQASSAGRQAPLPARPRRQAPATRPLKAAASR